MIVVRLVARPFGPLRLALSASCTAKRDAEITGPRAAIPNGSRRNVLRWQNGNAPLQVLKFNTD